MSKKQALERAVKGLDKKDRDQAFRAFEDMETDQTKGLIRLEDYTNSDLNLSGWTLTSVLDDILMCQFADINQDGTMIKRGDLWIPLNANMQAWRVGKVILAGPRAKTKPGDHVIFPSTFGLKASNINGMQHICFLNEDRIFGVASLAKK